jgi:peptide deformylase
MGDVSEFIKDNKDLLEKFVCYAKELDNAVGLAANQVALEDERLMDRFCMVKNSEDSWVLAIDPKIISTFGKQRDVVEGCLTWGDSIDILAKRYPRVKIEYYDINAKKHSKVISDNFESQIWQHEINHLNGVEEVLVPRIVKAETYRRSEEKIGRNDPCPCDSGKKYKKCCLKAAV